MEKKMRRLYYEAEFCVVGGGLSGFCAAIAAARHGTKTILIHDRPVLGGNASSEVRMWIRGAHGQDRKETGIVEELILENYYRNPQNSFSVWDGVLYGMAMYQENLTVLLNSSVLDAECEGQQIKRVTAWQSNAETFHIVKAQYFADCSGDSILAPLSGAEYRYGREAKSEFGETIPPDVADKKTMGMSCLFQIRETDHKTEYHPPKWAYVYEQDSDLPKTHHDVEDNFWWIEVGGEWDCIHDSDRCREECLKICHGVWDHMKNRGDHGCDNWEMEWIGFLPGKRESRRYVGEYTVTQNDVEAEGKFEDIVAYAGWTMDDHFPQGFYYREGRPTIYHPAPSPWGLPLRCMISKNIQNLVFAGRNISVTHAALSSSRVMATCGILGQAIGTAVSQAVADDTDIREIDIKKLQNTLMTDDCYLPWQERQVADVCKKAECSSEIVRDGVERGEEHCWIGAEGETITYTFTEDINIQKIYLTFDSDLNRKYHNMPCNFKLDRPASLVPDTLIKSYRIVGTNSTGEQKVLEVHDSHQRFITHMVDWDVNKLEFIPVSTYGCKEYRVFRFEIE